MSTMDIHYAADNLPEGYIRVGMEGTGLYVPMPRSLQQITMTVGFRKNPWPIGNSIEFPFAELNWESRVTSLLRHMLGVAAIDSIINDGSLTRIEIPDAQAEVWQRIGHTVNAHHEALGLT